MNPQRLLAALALASASLYSIASANPLSKLSALQDISESCSPSGVIKDACCEYKTIEQVNDEIAPYLDDLVKTSFFRYVKIDLNRGCKFWKEDGLCVNEGCAVQHADESDLPKDLRTESLSSVDYSLTAQASFPFFQKSCEFNDADFCVIDDPVALREVPYVNLVKNPERFTGYAGDSAARVWGAIYKENCFGGGEEVSGALGGLLEGERGEGQCMEKRVFYRLVSGLHSSISTHICDQWLDQKTGTWSRNLDCFKYRLGKFPERIQNMYFTYVVLLRAISKISPYLETTEWCSSATDKKRIGTLMKGIVEKTLSCPPTFDETTMFTDSATASLKEEFKNHFRNISLIMDCVGCEKCRLWGKLQITGLGTALKILFSFGNDPSLYRLTRTELVSLINGFHRISNSLRAVERFRNRIKDQTDVLLELSTASSSSSSASFIQSAATAAPEMEQTHRNAGSPLFIDMNDTQNMVKWSVGALVMVIGFVGLFYGQTSETKAVASAVNKENESQTSPPQQDSGSEGSVSPKSGLKKRTKGKRH